MPLQIFIKYSDEKEVVAMDSFSIGMIAGPIIGSVIGYGTNYIAVKMLFRPIKPIKIGGFTLPFTPGVIPKRKDELAVAIANAVADTLLTKDDIKDLLLQESVTRTIVESISDTVFNENNPDEKSIKESLSVNMNTDVYFDLKEKIIMTMCDKIVDGLCEINISKIIASEGSKAIKEKTEGTFMAMFANDELIESMAEPIGKKIEKYIVENGDEMITPIVSKEFENVLEQTPSDIMNNLEISKESIEKIISGIYVDLISNNVDKITEVFDIKSIISNKVKDMDVMEIENLVMSVMKHELNTVVNLGALIGFVIGILTIFF